MARQKYISAQEVSKHCTASDCWLVVENKIWDFTDFASVHPGGEAGKCLSLSDYMLKVILQYAGHDATKAYQEVHSAGLIESTLSPSKLKGDLDTNTIDSAWTGRPASSSIDQSPSQTTPSLKPPLTAILSTHDFERVAQDTLTKKAWAFFSSGATDMLSVDANKSFYNRIWFRPRLLRNVEHVNTRCRMQGVESSLPIMVAPAAMAKLAHEEGEKAVARGAASQDIIHCIATTASYSLENIVTASPSNTRFFFQLYVHRDRTVTIALLKRVWAMGIRTIMLTIDAPVPGKREADERVRTDRPISMPMTGTIAKNDKMGSGLTRTTGGFIDSTLDWEDLAWLKTVWKGNVMLKGVQCVEDAQRAVQEGIDGIILSNHGGRNLDTSPPALLTLLELHRFDPSLLNQTEVYIDGGVSRGTDILKALCLGARGVLIGRPFLYALNYGEEGVIHLIELLRNELETAMRLVGMTEVSQAHPGLVNTKDLDHLVSTPSADARRPAKL